MFRNHNHNFPLSTVPIQESQNKIPERAKNHWYMLGDPELADCLVCLWIGGVHVASNRDGGTHACGALG